MKPYIAQILEHNGKITRLPMPSKYRELLDCVKTLGLKDEADEDDLRVIGYETLMDLPIPDAGSSQYGVEQIAEMISSLTSEKIAVISAICDRFDVGYMSIVAENMTKIIDRGDYGEKLAVMEKGEFTSHGYLTSKNGWNLRPKMRPVPENLNLKGYLNEDLYVDWDADYLI